MNEPAGQKQAIARFLQGCSFEVTPGGLKKVPDSAEVLPAGTRVFVTHLPDSDYRETIETAARLRREGMRPVPHLAARSIASRAALEEHLARLQAEAAPDEALVIAGGVTKPVGEFDSSIQVLETGLLQRYGIRRIGVAGHPEGSPDISPELRAQALRDKNEYARRHGAELYLATQFCFEAEPVIEWERTIRQEGNALPVHIGLPGLATIKTLIGHARACGVGASMRVLTRQAADIARLMTTRSPAKLLRELADHATRHPESRFGPCHVYPFGGLKKSADWVQAVVAGNFELDDEDGFSLSQAPL